MGYFMKKFILVMISIFVFSGCDQFPIFFTVSKEVEPKEPKIDGSPTRIITSNPTSSTATLYVANGKIWSSTYGSGDWIWNSHSNPPSGNVVDIAYSGSNLYALTLDYKSGYSIIWKFDSNTWSSLVASGGMRYQAIYGANNNLYAAYYNKSEPSRAGKDFCVVKINPSGGESWRSGETYFLSGVVYSTPNYYFATTGDGIFVGGDTALPADRVTTTPGNEVPSKNIAAILSYDTNKVAATSFDGYVYQINGTTASASGDLGTFTRALAYWKHGITDEELLLIGVKIDSTRFGYREMKITSGDIDLSAVYTPEKSSGDKDVYAATFEPNALTSLMQAPGSPYSASTQPLTFASTERNGLWSFRRDSAENRYVWNKED